MKFSRRASDQFNVVRYLSEGGTIEACIHPVIYGYRIRCGFAEEPSCNWDWCAGDNVDQIAWFLSAALTILESREEGPNAFEGIPTVSQIKPANRDVNFLKLLLKHGAPALAKDEYISAAEDAVIADSHRRARHLADLMPPSHA